MMTGPRHLVREFVANFVRCVLRSKAAGAHA
jgi:hypothetical protein